MSFKNTHLSVSRLKKYEKCALEFYYSYVDKGETEPRHSAGPFGNCLHEALEATFQWVINEEFSGLFPTDVLIQSYKEAWRATFIDGGNVNLFQTGLVILRAYAERHATVDHFQILAVEQEFRLQAEEFTILGYIDRVEKLGDDGVLIVDYKSGQNLFSREELESDLQAATYLLVGKTLFPWAKRIEFAFDMLRFNTRQGVQRTPQQIEDVREYLVALGRKTETDEEWKPTLNALCGWCDHRGRCPEYQKALKGGRALTKIATLEGVEEIAKEREEITRLANMFYAHKKKLDELIKAKISKDGEFDAANTHYRLVNSNTTTYTNRRPRRPGLQ